MNFLLLVSTFVLLPSFVGAASLVFAQSHRRRKPNAILFHAVSSGLKSGLSNVRPETFGEFVQLLADRKISTKTVSGILAQADIGSLAITFDDGYSDIYEACLPILLQADFVATVYMISARIGAKSGWDIYSGKQMLSAPQLRELSDAGWEIGSHSHSHPDLTLLSETDLDKELSYSKMLLEDIVGKSVDSISFPFGKWNRRVWEAAERAGYRTACSYGHPAPEGLPIIETKGTYLFDSAEDILARCEIGDRCMNLNSIARGILMPHFSKGSPLWNFRKEYRC